MQLSRYIFLIALLLIMSITAIIGGIYMLIDSPNSGLEVKDQSLTDTQFKANISQDKKQKQIIYAPFNEEIATNSNILELTDFHNQEPSGRWTQKKSYLSFYAPEKAELFGIKIKIQAKSLDIKKPSSFFYRSSPNGKWYIPTIAVEGPQTITLFIPARHISEDRFLQIKIDTPLATSPKNLNINEDTRILGMFIENISLYQGS